MRWREVHGLKEERHLSAFWDNQKCDDGHPLPRAHPWTRIGGRGVGNAREEEPDTDGRRGDRTLAEMTHALGHGRPGRSHWGIGG
jgi:hypothetical protein